jgi:hypothetical protein
MLRRKRLWIWVGRGVAAAIIGGLAVHLYRVGLETADKLGSSIGLLVAATALVAPYLLPPSRFAPRPTSVVSEQIVEDATVVGDLVQHQRIPGQGGAAPSASSGSRSEPSRADDGPPGGGTQSVTHVWVGGSLRQVQGTDRDVPRQ